MIVTFRVRRLHVCIMSSMSTFKVVRCHRSAAGVGDPEAADRGWGARASSRTASPPTATAEAIRPRASTRTADGVPVTPNACPMRNPMSSTTVDYRPILTLASTLPVDTTSSFVASLKALASHAFKSSSIC
jgi:hypothetical protein